MSQYSIPALHVGVHSVIPYEMLQLFYNKPLNLQTEGVWERGVEENIWTKEGW
jgi:hypothetical protein